MNLTMHVTLLTDAEISRWDDPDPGMGVPSGHITIARTVAENSIAVDSLIFEAKATSDGSVTDYTLVSSTDSVGTLTLMEGLEGKGKWKRSWKFKAKYFKGSFQNCSCCTVKAKR